MDFTREWTPFALEAEHDAFGMARIAKAHNDLRTKLEATEREAREAREVSDYLTGTPDVPEQLVDYAREQVERAEAAEREWEREIREAFQEGYERGAMEGLADRVSAAVADVECRHAALREAVEGALGFVKGRNKDVNAVARRLRAALAEATTEDNQ